jgi:PiT family inorganic phosphate transporter
MKRLIKNDKLYKEPEGAKPPPPIIRGVLIFTCTAVSFAHGGNDGQKGMGLIMLILIGVAPTAYALNRTMPDASTPAFVQATQAVAPVFAAHAQGQGADPSKARAVVSDALRKHDVNQPQVFAALGVIAPEINQQVQAYGGVKHVPAAQTKNLRNDMYLVYDALRLITKDKKATDKAFPNG